MRVRNDVDNGKLVAPLGCSPGPHKLAVWVSQRLSRQAGTVRRTAMRTVAVLP